jgi:amino acid transporter
MLILAMLAVVIGSFLPALPTFAANIISGFIGWGTSLLAAATTAAAASATDAVTAAATATATTAAAVAAAAVKNATGGTRQVLEQVLSAATTGAPSASGNSASIWFPQFSADPNTGKQHGFFSVFSVFFPAVTGIMAGANMSGDLARPSLAIPKGTLSAIGVTYFTYILLVFVLGGVAVRCVGVDSSDLAAVASAAGSLSFAANASSAVNGTSTCPATANEAWAKRVMAAEVIVPEGGLLYNKLIMQNIAVWSPLVYTGAKRH